MVEYIVKINKMYRIFILLGSFVQYKQLGIEIVKQ
jgi:hypothetical protein